MMNDIAQRAESRRVSIGRSRFIPVEYLKRRTVPFQRIRVHFFATCAFRFGRLRVWFQKRRFFERFSHEIEAFVPADEFGRAFA
jgi:hypothetical protein